MLAWLVLSQLGHEYDARLCRWIVLPFCWSLGADRTLPGWIFLSQRHKFAHHQRMPARKPVSDWQRCAHFVPAWILLCHCRAVSRDGPVRLEPGVSTRISRTERNMSRRFVLRRSEHCSRVSARLVLSSWFLGAEFVQAGLYLPPDRQKQRTFVHGWILLQCQWLVGRVGSMRRRSVVPDRQYCGETMS